MLSKSMARYPRKRREDKVAKGQLRSNREKKKPKAEKNRKESVAPARRYLSAYGGLGKTSRQEVLVAQSAQSRGEKSAATSS